MIAREWLDRGNRKIDPIDAFTCFWCGFNHLYSQATGNSEIKKIEAFLDQHISEEVARTLLQSYEPEIAYLISEPVIDMRGNGRNTSANIRAFRATNDSLAKLQEVFMIIYQVRCNLIHGQKSPSGERDVQLCQFASPLVANLVGHNA